MRRVTAVTTLLLVAGLLAVALTAAAPAAPRWPAAALAWWQDASPHLDTLETAVTDAWAAYPAEPDTVVDACLLYTSPSPRD